MDILVEPSGQILVAGYVDKDIVVACYNSDGTGP